MGLFSKKEMQGITWVSSSYSVTCLLESTAWVSISGSPTTTQLHHVSVTFSNVKLTNLPEALRLVIMEKLEMTFHLPNSKNTRRTSQGRVAPPQDKGASP